MTNLELPTPRRRRGRGKRRAPDALVPPQAPSLDSAGLLQLARLFERRGWPRTDDQDPIFERFAWVLARLDPPTRALVFALAEDFERITSQRHDPLLGICLDELGITEGVWNQFAQVVVLPILAPEDEGKAKSGTQVVYSAETRISRLTRAKANSRQVKRYATYEAFGKREDCRGKTLLVLVDDFVGTGDTATKALDHFAGFSKPSDVVFVAALVCMSRGREVIKPRVARLGIGQELGRGIADNYRIQDKARAYELIDALEQKLGVSKDYRRGYGQSEALVTLRRTPNNTLPVFWWESGSNDAWQPVFPR